ncbi:hypothetical protein FGO68_gene7744 [Halteria grandinella]|uniref:Uncharacterized protein n=1 Tax=Halteria grandinella TaxID=5974 RepID=A0A8J8NA88_HALGN|nr:hypothetical protein FGO68_gene7744 [Halteria grandinella]
MPITTGIYRARAVCSFIREGEMDDQEIESEPITFEITEQHIKDYLATQDYQKWTIPAKDRVHSINYCQEGVIQLFSGRMPRTKNEIYIQCFTVSMEVSFRYD